MIRGVRRRTTFSMSIAMLLLVAFSVAPAGAAGSAKPDARIAYTSSCCDPYVEGPGTFKGGGIYNTTATKQTIKIPYYGTSMGLGRRYFATIRIKNTGTAAGSFKVKVTPGPNNWDIKYTIPFDDITAEVEAGTLVLPSLAPGEFWEIYLEIDLDSLSGTPNRLITFTSVSNPTKKDAVKFVMKLKTCSC